MQFENERGMLQGTPGQYVACSRVMQVDWLEMHSSERAPVPEQFTEKAAEAARRFHQSVKGYERTPLVSLRGLAVKWGVRGIYVKDESKRFSLNAFKGLGGSYAMFRILCDKLGLDPEKTEFKDLMTEENQEKLRQVTFVTATDGNHGRGVSWASGIFGCKVHVYMPCGSEEIRAEAIRKAGPAEVRITDMNYDDTVKYASKQSEAYGWHLIQDTAWEGYEQIPLWIIQGYLTMASEAVDQIREEEVTPTHVFLQAGVGAMAGGVLGYIAQAYGAQKPLAAIVEPEAANCIYTSAKAGDGNAHSVEGMPETIMAGLNCGTPCMVTWPVLRDYAEYYLSCPDFAAAQGMRVYADPVGGDPKIVSGESGAATMGALSLLLGREEFSEIKRKMNLDRDSVILLINTEGDTDPEGYKKVVEQGAYPLPD